MSRLPPISRGGIVRSPALAAAGIAVSGKLVGDGAACIRDRLLALGDRLHQLLRGRDADDAGEGVSRNGHARQLRRSRAAAGDVPVHEERVGEEICEEAEAGDDGGHAEVGGLVGDELDLEHVARLRALDLDGAGQRMAEPEVEREHVACVLPGVSWPSRPSRVSSVISSPGRTVATGSRSGCQRLCALSAGILKAAPPPGSAASVAAAISSPSRFAAAELVHRDDRAQAVAVAGRASRSAPPGRRRRRASAGRPGRRRPLRQSSCTTCRPRAARVRRAASEGRPCAPPGATPPRQRAPRG